MFQALRFSFAAMVFFAAGAYANTVVVPNDLLASEGNSNNLSPFNGFVGVNRYQQVYDSAAFDLLAKPSYITQIAFRPDTEFGTEFSHTIANVGVNLSTTSVEPDGMSRLFDENSGANLTTVYSGELTLSSSNVGFSPKQFDVVIDLQNPFFYDPRDGNLLFEFLNYSGEIASPFFRLDAHNTATDSISRVFSRFSDATASRGDIIDSFGLVTRFSTTTSLSEPATLPVAMIGFLLITIIHRRLPG